jgi:hypothetical protein
VEETVPGQPQLQPQEGYNSQPHSHMVHLFSIILQIHTVNTPQEIPDGDFYKFTLVKFSTTGQNMTYPCEYSIGS